MKHSAKRKRGDVLGEQLNEDGSDISLMTGLEYQRFELYAKTRCELAAKYPNPTPQELREDPEDTIDIREARNDPKAPIFIRALMDTYQAFEKIGILQHLATEQEKKIIRFYAHLTLNWPQHGAEFLKLLEESDLYEIVESYFKILRKYGLSTYEEPYYFLSPRQRRNVKLKGEMLRRSTQIDDGEIKVSLLEDFP